MRGPYLEPGTDRQFDMLQDLGFLYDSTFVTHDSYTPAWPFTLDFPVTQAFCTRTTCPKRSYPGIWELPLNRWIRSDGSACDMLDGCPPDNLYDKKTTLSYLWANFERHYRHKTPLGVHLHAIWFKDPWKLEALDEFIQELGKRDDVYLITMYQMIQWMRAPTPLQRLRDFQPWRTSCTSGNRGSNNAVKHTSSNRGRNNKIKHISGNRRQNNEIKHTSGNREPNNNAIKHTGGNRGPNNAFKPTRRSPGPNITVIHIVHG